MEFPQIPNKLHTVSYRLHTVQMCHIRITCSLHTSYTQLHTGYIQITNVTYDLHTAYIRFTYRFQFLLYATYTTYGLHMINIRSTYTPLMKNAFYIYVSCADISLPIAGRHRARAAGGHASSTAASAGYPRAGPGPSRAGPGQAVPCHRN